LGVPAEKAGGFSVPAFLQQAEKACHKKSSTTIPNATVFSRTIRNN